MFSKFFLARPIFYGDEDDVESEDLSHGSGRILFMDDNMSVISTASKMLEHIGFTVESAADGEEKPRGSPYEDAEVGIAEYLQIAQSFRVRQTDDRFALLSGGLGVGRIVGRVIGVPNVW